MTTLITGPAGAGKSTYASENFEDVFYHDEWASAFRKKEEVHNFICGLLGFLPQKHRELSAEQILTNLMYCKDTTKIYANYFKNHFEARMDKKLERGVDAIEIPYLSRELSDLKTKHGFKIVYIERPIHDCADHLKNVRGWSDYRINFTLLPQMEGFIKHRDLIDERVTLE